MQKVTASVVVALVLSFLSPTYVGASSSYSKSPSGTLITSPVTIFLDSTEGPSDFNCDPVTQPSMSLGFWAVGNETSIPSYQTPAQAWTPQLQYVVPVPPATYSNLKVICGEGVFSGIGKSLEGGDAYGSGFIFTVIAPAPLIITENLAGATVGIPYSQILQAANGNLPLNWFLVSGSLPAGLSLDTATGEISGTPTTAQAYEFMIQVMDTRNQSAAKNFSVTVNGTTTATLEASGDTYIDKAEPNQNEGARMFMKLQRKGQKRSLVQFNPQAILSAVGSGTVVSATLELDIQGSGNNWGVHGRTIDIHSMTRAWTELGATWHCANDTNTNNSVSNCVGNEWKMNKEEGFSNVPTASKNITNGLTGPLSFDVTSDIQSFLNGATAHQGWVIKKTDENKTGWLQFASRESGHGPRLKLVVNH